MRVDTNRQYHIPMSGGFGSDDASLKWQEAWQVVCQTPALFDAYEQAAPGDVDGARTALAMGIIAENDRQRQMDVQAHAVPSSVSESDTLEWNACFAGEQALVSPELTRKLHEVVMVAQSAGVDFASIANPKEAKDADTQTVDIKEETTVKKEKTVKKTRKPRKQASPSASSGSDTDVSDYVRPTKKARAGRRLRASASAVQGMYTDPPDLDDNDLIRLEQGGAEERPCHAKTDRPVRANRQGVTRYSPSL